jgi:hypothetical protein
MRIRIPNTEKIYLVEVTILKISRSGPNLCCLLSKFKYDIGGTQVFYYSVPRRPLKYHFQAFFHTDLMSK